MNSPHLPRTGVGRAFTLLELLIVIAIVALIATVSFTIFGSVKSNAARMQGVRSFEQIWKAIETYKAQNQGYYPGSSEDGGGLSSFQSPTRTSEAQLGFWIHNILHLKDTAGEEVSEYEVREMVPQNLEPILDKAGRQGWGRNLFYLFHVRSDIAAADDITLGAISRTGSYWGKPGAVIEFNRSQAPMLSDIYLGPEWDDYTKGTNKKTLWGTDFNVLFVDGHVESKKENDFDWKETIKGG